jgi:hypothetical protein
VTKHRRNRTLDPTSIWRVLSAENTKNPDNSPSGQNLLTFH